MLDVFDTLRVPRDFVGTRVARLEKSAGKYGIAVQCRWVERCQLGTSQIERLRAPLRRPIVEDLSSLKLRLSAPDIVGSYAQAFHDFAQHVLARARLENQFFERVLGPFGRIHFVRAFRTKALCGQDYVCHDTTNANVSCRKCISEALRQQRAGGDPTIPFPALRPTEMLVVSGR